MLIDNSLLATNGSFTELTKNKFIVVLTNGEDGTSNIIKQVADSGTYIVTGLIGNDRPSEGFGTPENPTAGAVKEINIDTVNLIIDEVMEKVNTFLHNDVSNINITEIFDSKITENFEIEILTKTEGTTISKSDNSQYIWNIPLLTAQATATLDYKIKLKDNNSIFNRKLLNLPINTSSGITTTYIDGRSASRELRLSASPKIKIIEEYGIIVQAVEDWDQTRGIKRVKFEIIGTNEKDEEIINMVSYVDDEGKIKIDGIKAEGELRLKIKERVVPGDHKREEEAKTVIIVQDVNTGEITCKTEDEKIETSLIDNKKNVHIGVKIVETANIAVKDVNSRNNRYITGSHYILVQPEGKETLKARTYNYYGSYGTYYGGAKFAGDKLPPGEYTYIIKQESPADGYDPIEDFEVKITYDKDGKISKAIVEENDIVETRIIDEDTLDIIVKSNMPVEEEKQGELFQVEINDVDAEDPDKKIQNITYGLNVKTLKTTMDYSGTTDENGKAIIEDVYGIGETRIIYSEKSVPGEYKSKEKEGQKLVTVYVDPDTKKISIVENRTTVGLDVKIQDNKLIINETHNKKLVRNTIRVKAGEKENESVALRNVTFTITCPNGETLTAKTEKLGYADINDIEAPGEGTYTYKVEQNTTPIDYVEAKRVVYVRITFDKDGNISAVETVNEEESVTGFITNNQKEEIFKIAEVKIFNEPKEVRKFTIKVNEKDSIENKPVSGVVLRIETEVTIDGEISSKIVQRTTDASGKLEYEIPDGEKIKLTIQEIKPKDGFVADSGITSIIIENDESGNKQMTGDTENATLSNEEINLERISVPKNGIKKTRTTFQIEKVTEDGKILKDVKFTMKETRTEDEWDLTTDENGIGKDRTNNLPVFTTERTGKYQFYLEETETIEGYIKPEDLVGFTVYYEINDENNMVMSTMQLNDGISYDYVIDQKYSQEYNKEYLEVFIEMKIISKPNTEVSLNNINIEKIALNENGESIPVAGSQYEVAINMPDEKSIIVRDITNTEGKMKLSNIKFPEGKTVIELTEIKPADSYKWDKETKTYEITCKDGILNLLSGEATITGNDVNITLIGEKVKGFNIEIDKVDSMETKKLLKASIFEATIISEDGTRTYRRLVDKEKGKLFINDVYETGEIRLELKETKAPAGYELDSTLKTIVFRRNTDNGQMTVDRTKTENIDIDNIKQEQIGGKDTLKITIPNVAKPSIAMLNIDKDNGAVISGARFNIQIPTNEGTQLRELEGTNDWQSVVIDDGIQGRYEIVQTETGEGYTLSKKIAIDVEFDENRIPISVNVVKDLGEEYQDTVEQISIKGKQIQIKLASQKTPEIDTYTVKIEKRDSRYREIMLEGAKFNFNITSESGGKLTFKDKITSNKGILYLNKITGTGEITIEIEETVAPKDHKLDKNKKTVVINRNKETNEISFTSSNRIEENDVIIDNDSHIITIIVTNDAQNTLIIENQDIDNENKKLVGTDFILQEIEQPDAYDDIDYENIGNLEYEVKDSKLCETKEQGIATGNLGQTMNKTKVLYRIINNEDKERWGYIVNKDIYLEIEYNEENKIKGARILKGDTDKEGRLVANFDETVPFVNDDVIKIIIRNEKKPTKTNKPSEGTTEEDKDPSTRPDKVAPDTLYDDYVPPGTMPDWVPGLTYTIQIEKVNTYNEKIKIKDAKYSINVYNEDGTGTTYTGLTDRYGNIELSDLTGYGQIRAEITELRAPEGYLLDVETKIVTFNRDMGTRYLTLDESNTTSGITVNMDNMNKIVKVKLTEAQAKDRVTLALVKKDLEDETINLRNAEFQIIDQETKEQYKLVTDRYGMSDMIINKKTDGEHKFTIKEINAPMGYVLDETERTLKLTYEDGKLKTATITKGDIVKTSENYVEINIQNVKKEAEEGDIPYSIEIIKSDANFTSLVFQDALIKTDITNQIGQSDITKTALTNEDGKIYINNIYGSGNIDITITELEPPKGRRFDTKPKEVHLKKNEETGYISITEGTGNVDTYIDNDKKIVYIRIRNYEEADYFTIGFNKVDSENKAISLLGAEFTLTIDGIAKDLPITESQDGMYIINNIPMPYVKDEAIVDCIIKETVPPKYYIQNTEDILLRLTIRREGDLQKIVNAEIISGEGEVRNAKEQFVYMMLTNKSENPKDSYSITVNKVDSKDKTIKIKDTLLGVTVKAETGEGYYQELYTDAEGKIELRNIIGYGRTKITVKELAASEGYTTAPRPRILEINRKEDGHIGIFDQEGDIVGESETIEDKENLKITITNDLAPEYFSMRLEKYIEKIGEEIVENREPTVTKNDEGKLEWKINKNPIHVEKGQKLVFNFRVYNQGSIDGYANIISDTLPEGLVLPEASDINSQYDWAINPKTEKLETSYLSKEKGETNLIPALNEQKRRPDYKEVKLELMVEQDTEVPTITNIGKIEEQVDKNGKIRRPAGATNATESREYLYVKKDITVIKHWMDTEEQKIRRPEKIRIVLKRGTEEIESKEIGTTQDETIVFNNLLRYNDQGTEIEYTVEEQEINDRDLRFYDREYTQLDKAIVITNTYHPLDKKINVTIDKEWIDTDEQKDKRPAGIKIVLRKGEEEVASKIIETKMDESVTFKELPLYDEDGYVINYVGDEEELSEGDLKFYEKSYDPETNTITNTFKRPEDLVDIAVHKTWIDTESQKDKRPEKIRIILKTENEEIVGSEEITTEEDKSVVFNDLPKYDENGNEIKYIRDEEEIQKDDLKFYEKSYDEVTNTIINTFKKPNNKVDVAINKYWADTEAQKARRPAKIRILLKHGDNVVASQEIEPERDAYKTVTFKDMPMYDEDGNVINYVGDEEELNEGDLKFYVKSYDEETKTVINTFRRPEDEVSVTINKHWVDEEEQKDKRPEKISIILKNDEKVVVGKEDISTEEDKSVTFSNLPMYDRNGNVIDYVGSEEEIKIGDLKFYEKTYNHETKTITNTFKRPAEKTSVTINKHWEDTEEQKHRRPEKIRIMLKHNGTVVANQDITTEGDKTVTFDNLLLYDGNGNVINYVGDEEEIEVDDLKFYEKSYDNVTKTITNTFKKPADTADVAVNKQWIDNPVQSSRRPEKIRILLKHGENVVASQEISTATNQIITFKDIPIYDENGNVIRYSGDEEEINEGDLKFYVKSYDSDSRTLINTFKRPEDEVSVTINKHWADTEEQKHRRPAQIKMILRNGQEVVGEEDITTEEDKSVTFNKLPKYDEDGRTINYVGDELELERDDLKFYEKSYNEETKTVINTFKRPEEKASITITKHWVDTELQKDKRPTKIKILLKHGKEIIEQKEITTEEDKTVTFHNILIYDGNGNEINYVADEVEVNTGDLKFYEKSYDEETKTITNTFRLPVDGSNEQDISIRKEWKDTEKQKNKRPERIKIVLRKGEEEVASKEITTEEDKTVIFEDLPVYDKNGDEISYTGDEEELERGDLKFYQKSYYSDSKTIINTFRIPTEGSTKNVEVRKEWKDTDAQKHRRPETIKIILKHGGVEIANKVIETKTDSIITFENIPKYDENGDEIEYTADEEEVNEGDLKFYEKSYNEVTKTIINTFKRPEDKTSIAINKHWVDTELQKDKRPEKIKLLIKNKNQDRRVAGEEITTESDKTVIFEDLFVYDENGNIINYVGDEEELEKDDLKFYAKSYDEQTKTVINTFKVPEEFVDVEINKHWVDTELQKDKRPEKIRILLMRGNTEVTNREVYTEEDVSVTFNDVSKYDQNGNIINYSGDEEEINAGDLKFYEKSYDNETKTIINTFKRPEEKKEEVIVKKWIDTEAQKDKRPEKIKIQIIYNGIMQEKEIEVTNEEMKAIFGDLYKYDENGNEIEYTAVEGAINEDDLKFYESIYDPETKTITNRFKKPNDKVDITINKHWVDTEEQKDKRPEKIKLLVKNGDEIVREQEITTEEDKSVTFRDLDKYDENGNVIEYVGDEEELNEGDLRFYRKSYAYNTRTIVNTFIRPDENINVEITKHWVDTDLQKDKRPEKIKILLKTGGEIVGEQEITTEEDKTVVFENMPKYNEYGNIIEYYGDEEELNIGDLKFYVKSYNNDTKTIVNTFKKPEEKKEEIITKKWEDTEDQKDKRPEKIKVQIIYNGEVIGEQEIEVTEEELKAIFGGLDKYDENGNEIEYEVGEKEVNEEDLKFYESIYDPETKTLTNKFRKPEDKVDVTITKHWIDTEEQKDKRPEKIKLLLKKGQEVVGSEEITTEEDKSVTFTGLDKYDENGNIIIYSGDEEELNEGDLKFYQKSYSSSMKAVINTFKKPEEPINIAITKHWVDTELQKDKRPEKIKLLLKTGTETVGEQEITTEQDKTVVFEDMPKYDENGNVIEYYGDEQEINEGDLKFYVKSYRNDTRTIINTFKRPEDKVEEVIIKKWEDTEEQKDKRPEKIKIQIIHNEEVIEEKEIEVTNEEMKAIFAGLYKYDENGNIIQYTAGEGAINEQDLKFYESTYDPETKTLTNRFKRPEDKVDVTITKHWIDTEEQKDKRPEKIKLLLKEGQEVVGSEEITTEEDKSVTFRDLDKYDENGNVIEYVGDEEEIEEGDLKFYQKSYAHDTRTVINTFKRPEDPVDIAITKHWVDTEEQKDKRPEKIKLLLKNNNNEIASMEITTEEDKTVVFENMPKYDGNGNVIEYYGDEQEINEDDLKFYQKSYDSDSRTIINTFKRPEDKVEEVITKKWEDTEAQKDKRPQKIKIRILHNNEVIEEKEIEVTEEELKAIFGDLYKYDENGNEIEYTADEGEINDEDLKFYESIYDPETKILTNRFRKPEDKVDVTITKHWVDNEKQSQKRPEKIKILLKNGTQIVGSKEITTEEDKSVTFKGLDKYDENGNVIDYYGDEEELNEGDLKFYQKSYDHDTRTVINTFRLPIDGSNEQDIIVRKEWKDNEKQKKRRPEKIKLQLKNGREIVEEAEITTEEDKSVIFEKVPVYNGDGEKIEYYGDEAEINTGDLRFYQKSYDHDTRTIINTFRLPTDGSNKQEIAVSKEWIDTELQKDKRPEKIKLLLKKGQEIVGEQEITTEEDKTVIFRNIPIYNQDGEDIEYVGDEEEINVGDLKFYEKSYDTNRRTIINTFKTPKDTININLQKHWVDTEEQKDKRPEKIKILLKTGGEVVEEAEITTEKDKQIVFENVPKYDGNGNEIEYELKEEEIEEGDLKFYKSSYNPETRILTNTFIKPEEKISIAITKHWVDTELQKDKRPEKIKILLKADGKVVEEAEITTEEDKIVTFNELPAYDENGNVIRYSGDEEELNEGDLKFYVKTIDVTGRAITNTFKKPEDKIEEVITKNWVDTELQKDKRPEKIKIRILHNNEIIGEQEIEVTEEELKAIFGNLDKYDENGDEIEYTVGEGEVNQDDLKFYESTYDPETKILTNTFKKPEDKIDVAIEKHWIDTEEQKDKRPEKIKLLLKNGGEIVGEQEITTEEDKVVTFIDLDKYDENGNEIRYTADEEELNEGDLKFYVKTIDVTGRIVTNIFKKPEDTININLQKHWEDTEEQSQNRPEKIKLQLIANGEVIDEKEITTEEDKQIVFENVPKYDKNGNEIAYKLKEVELNEGDLKFYKASYDPETKILTNTFVRPQEKTNITVEKHWIDTEEQKDKRPEKIRILLKTGGQVVKETEITTEEDKQIVFEDVLKYNENGEKIEYIVDEEELNEGDLKFYVKTIDITGKIITNTFKKPEDKTNVAIEKHWQDTELQRDKRPRVIKMLLKNGEEIVKETEITTEEDKVITFTGLEKYDENGNEIEYTADEEELNEGDLKFYVKTIDITGKIVTNTFKRPEDKIEEVITKNWVDTEEQKDKRPEKIIIRILYNENIVIEKEIEVTEEQLKAIFEGLDKYDENGNEIDYTVGEGEVNQDDLKFYKSTYDPETKTITNTFRVPDEKVDIAVRKEWKDTEEQKDKRPEKINILLKDGENVVASEEITTEEDKTVIFKDLPKYDENGNIINYIGDEEELNTGDLEFYIKSYNPETRTIINTFRVSDETVDVDITKHWEDTDIQRIRRPEKIKIILKNNGNEVASGEITTEEDKIVVFENMPKYDQNGDIIEYYGDEKELKENDLKFYVKSYDHETRTIINTYRVPDDTIDIKIIKHWEDTEEQRDKRPEKIKIQLVENGETVREAEITSEEDKQIVFEGLPKYDENGQERVYQLKEVELQEGDLKFYEQSYDPQTKILTNRFVKLEDKTNVTIIKQWKDTEEQRIKRPEKIKILLKNGNGEVVGTAEIDTEEDKVVTFEDLPKYDENGNEIGYYADEEEINIGDLKFYESTFDSETNTITNTFKIPDEKVEYRLVKKWIDTEKQKDKRPEKIRILLRNGNGQVVAEQEITSESDKEVIFTNLPKYDKQGNIIEYSVIEEEVQEDDLRFYESMYDEEEHILTNTFRVINENITIPVQKIWKDYDNKYNKRPEQINISLISQGEVIDRVTLQASENSGNIWEHEFTDLPKYDENGNTIQYSVIEEEVQEDDLKFYETVIDGYNIINVFSYNNIRFNMKIEKEISGIILNGESRNVGNPKLSKVEIYRKSVETSELIVEYAIRVTNETDLEGAGEILDTLPAGMEFIQSENPGWTQDRNTIRMNTGIMEVGETKEFSLVLRWQNSENNFGRKVNNVLLTDVKNDVDCPETTLEDNYDSCELIIAVSTGETMIQTSIVCILLGTSGIIACALYDKIKCQCQWGRR